VLNTPPTHSSVGELCYPPQDTILVSRNYEIVFHNYEIVSNNYEIISHNYDLQDPNVLTVSVMGFYIGLGAMSSWHGYNSSSRRN